MKKLVIGILAHVDAGKTTLSEAMLYQSGSIRNLGRVDDGDAFLDTHELERSRGITIFSKQAVFTFRDMQIMLLDTPGHVDFSAEMERTLQVLDYAVLVVSGMDGVQGHTLTLWRLLKKYNIPVFLFLNKMDQRGTEKEALLADLKKHFSEECMDFGRTDTEEFYEKAAVSDEAALEYFLRHGKLETETLRKLIKERKIFPCFFGSALKLDGVEELLEGLYHFTVAPVYDKRFAARVFKIARDEQGNRLTFLKITGGSLKPKTVLTGYAGKGSDGKQGEKWEEKVNQIRLYSGEKYTLREEAEAGCVCAVTGLTRTYPGAGLGAEQGTIIPVLEPVLTYQMELPPECDPVLLLPKLRQLEEEEPELHILWNEVYREIQVKIMGEVQTEVLQSLIRERFGVSVAFGTGRIVYKETIADTVEGVGHFEPLRHYAEVHLKLEPGEAGSGLVFAADCSEDILDKNWQRLILTHLEEKEHKGVLLGAPITDMKITLIAGKAHQKHTEGGDFRQATYRAVRQGLMEAHSVLLEPWYEFRLEIPSSVTGRAMTDIEKMRGSFYLPETEGGITVITGTAPVSTMRNYPGEVRAYTKGCGRLSCALKGYEPCRNAEEVMESSGYEPERDTENPASSVFCAHGAGFVVEWDEVKKYMHVDSGFQSEGFPMGEAGPKTEKEDPAADMPKGRTAGIRRTSGSRRQEEVFLGIDEVDAILAKANGANRKSSGMQTGGNAGWKSRQPRREETEPARTRTWKKEEKKEEYLLVDGYNIIFAWEDLKELAARNLDSARGRLMDILCNYQGIRKCSLILVFDAYRVQGHDTEITDYHNIHVVYTKEAETADQYIEKFAHTHGREARVTVATSDGLEQIIIRGQGCMLISARELRVEIDRAVREVQEEFQRKNRDKGQEKNYLLDSLTEEARQRLNGEQ